MEYELTSKIDSVVSEIISRKIDFENHLNLSTENLKRVNYKKDTNEQRYRYNLEKCTLAVMMDEAETKKCELFIKRCLAYKDYLKALKQEDLIELERTKYAFIKAFQEETIHDLTSRINKVNQKNILRKIAGKEIDIETRTSLMERKEDILTRFLEEDFKIDDNKVSSAYYLNFKTDELVDSLYPKKGKRRKAA